MSAAERAADRRVALLLGALVLVTFGPIVGLDTSQPASRYSLTAAVAEHGSVDLGPYETQLGVDRAVYQGHLRSDKAPGQPFLAVPVYLLGRALGADSAAHTHPAADLGLWWSTLWSATIPLAILVGLMFMMCARFARRRVAVAVSVTFGICTMLLPHAVNLFGHDLAALFGFGAWIAVEHSPLTPRRAALGGLLAGAAFATEYEAGIILAVLAVYVLVRDRARLAYFASGCAFPLLVLGWYQWAAFGAPWHTPASYFAGVIEGTSEGGYTIPSLHQLGSVLFGGGGLIVGAPIALVALVAAAASATRGTGAARIHAIVGLGVMIPYVVLCAGWSGTPTLVYPGPRYLIPALPFLAVPVAVLWDRFGRPEARATGPGVAVVVSAVATAALGAVISILAAYTDILIGTNAPLKVVLRRLRRHAFEPTLWSMALGRLGLFLYAASIAGALAGAILVGRRATRSAAGAVSTP
jgi:hypothetical protein